MEKNYIYGGHLLVFTRTSATRSIYDGLFNRTRCKLVSDRGNKYTNIFTIELYSFNFKWLLTFCILFKC